MSVLDILKPHLREFEGLRLEAYRCPAGVLTIGYGHTGGVTKGQTITEAEADNLLGADIARASESLVAVKVPLNDFQKAALISLVFNIGAGAFKKSTCLKRLNAGDYEGAAEALTWWNKVNGRTLAGLVRRREAERRMFLTGWHEVAETAPVGPVEAKELKPITYSKELTTGLGGALAGALSLWGDAVGILPSDTLDTLRGWLPYIIIGICLFYAANRLLARYKGAR